MAGLSRVPAVGLIYSERQLRALRSSHRRNPALNFSLCRGKVVINTIWLLSLPAFGSYRAIFIGKTIMVLIFNGIQPVGATNDSEAPPRVPPVGRVIWKQLNSIHFRWLASQLHLVNVGLVRTVPVHARRSEGPQFLHLPFVVCAANGRSEPMFAIFPTQVLVKHQTRFQSRN